MDLSNFINNDSEKQMSSELNTAQFDFQDIPSEMKEEVADEIVNTVDNESEKTKQNVLRDLFTSLADGYNANETINSLTKKYGTTVINDSICRLIRKFDNVIGNYFITCKYNDNKGKKNPAFIKYCLFCDCPDNEQIIKEKEFEQFGIDGFFNDSGKEKVKKIRICKKHNLPVLSSIDDLTEEEFKKLAEKVAEVKQVDQKEVLEKTENKSVIGKIRQIFANIKPKRVEAKIDSESYKMKDANIKANVVIGDEFKNANVNDVNKPKLDKVNIAKKENIAETKVSVPNNKINVKVGKEVKQIKSFTINPTKVDHVDLHDENKSINLKLGGKNINVAVEKESKFIDNVSIYTKPINDFDMKEDFEIELDDCQDNFDEKSIETKGDFCF